MIKEGRSFSSSWEQIRASSSLCREAFFFISLCLMASDDSGSTRFQRRLTSTTRCRPSRQARINSSDLLRRFFCGEGHQSSRVRRFLATHTRTCTHARRQTHTKRLHTHTRADRRSCFYRQSDCDNTHVHSACLQRAAWVTAEAQLVWIKNVPLLSPVCIWHNVLLSARVDEMTWNLLKATLNLKSFFLFSLNVFLLCFNFRKLDF